MTQASLFSFQSTGAAVVSPKASEQGIQAARVGGRIDLAILEWCRQYAPGSFLLSDFTADIVAQVACAPDSPRRRLVELVKQGHIQAECIDRSSSKWRVAATGGGANGDT
jgi:hypothetical protein